jgi:uncharacterized protein YneF (UPF0154 family)
MKRRHVALIAALVVVAMVAARWLGREPPTDEEQIRALFLGAARAAEERQIGGVMEVVSERFSGRSLDKQGVKRFVAGMVLRGDWVAVSVAGIAVSVQGELARANVDVVTARSGKGKAVADLLPQEGGAHRLGCRLEREEAGWRVVAAEWERIPLEEALAGPPPPDWPQGQ